MNRRNIVSLFLVFFVSLTFISCKRFQAKMEVKKGNDYYKARKYEDAIKAYKSALEKDPGLDTVHLNLGLSYMALYVPGSTHPKDLEYVDRAIASFKEYQKSNPDDTKVNEYLINMYLNADRKDDAIKYFEEQLARDNTNTAFMQKLAFLYAQSGKFDEALKWYERRAQVEPNNAEAYYIIGVICWEKSYKFADITPEERERVIKSGMAALEKAIRINSKYADAYLYMNLLLREKAKLISLDPATVPEDRVEEYNALLEKAKEFQQKAVALRSAANQPS
ncbi:tetratricopeptide repeat protein [bacterium]|nr:tetratricopeptide repeat protein [bacterium]MCI0606752.1 tetratricopeptide repeat protein [bacterium]